MEMNKYQIKAARTIRKELTTAQLLQNAALGLAGEAGEVADHIKKVYYQGHPLNPTELINELGDVLWYIAEMCTALGIDMSEAAEANVNKLLLRYPDGFDAELSINRKV